MQTHMGIYSTIQPCGCEIESYLGYDSTSMCFPCVAHGGSPRVVAGRQARRWAGPVNPYADPEDTGMKVRAIQPVSPITTSVPYNNQFRELNKREHYGYMQAFEAPSIKVFMIATTTATNVLHDSL
jgi:hypothetical protein